MKVTAIRQQVKRKDRFSIFVDEKYAFSLSDVALLESKLAVGQELPAGQLNKLKKLSEDDKLYNQTLRYVAMRPRSEGEIQFYLRRKKKVPPALADTILNKLSMVGLIDDEKLAKAFINDRRLFRPTSRRKLIAELRKKHISEEIIERAVGREMSEEQAALRAVVAKKRRQSKYRDDTRLMQYLARQGFNYGDIKQALNDD